MKNRENKLYAAYGSNMNQHQMAIRCPYATVIGNGMLEGYELLFRGGTKGAVATIEPRDGGMTPVLLWEITPRCEDALDRYEGWPRLYRKETVGVTFDGQVVEVMAYIMNEGYGLGSPCQEYLDTILEGYAAAAFDSQILRDAMEDSLRRGKMDRKKRR